MFEGLQTTASRAPRSAGALRSVDAFDEEEPELPDYPPAAEFPQFRERFGPRGVLHCWANEDGTQRIEDTGALSKKRMETIDDEVATSPPVS